MASRIWVVALGAVALAASCTSGPGAGPGAGGLAATPPAAGSAGRACTAHGCISLSRLARSIDTQLKGKVVGYVALVGPSIVVSSGLARTAADPPKLPMGPDVMVNVASVGKMFTTIAVLQSLARHHRSIDSRIWPFLPPDWVKGPGIDTITFRELLTHRAGFRLDSGLVFKTDDAAREQIKGLISGSLLSPSQRQQMDRNCLGWDCSTSSQAGYRGKDGGPYCDGSACLQIFFGILAGTIPVVIATNSDPGKPLFAIVQTAFTAAITPGNRHAGDPPGQMNTQGKLKACAAR